MHISTQFLFLLGLALGLCAQFPSKATSRAEATSLPLSVRAPFTYALHDLEGRIVTDPHRVQFCLQSAPANVTADFDFRSFRYTARLTTHSLSDVVVVWVDGCEFDQVHVTAHPPFLVQQELTRADGEAPETTFGDSIAVMDPFLVVGAPSLTQASVYQAVDGEWRLKHILYVPGLDSGAEFGRAVAISPIWIAVGAPCVSDLALASGAVFMFSHAFGRWNYRTRLDPPVPATSENFGASLALDYNTLLVGAPNFQAGAVVGAGAAYFFTFDGAWTLSLTSFGTTTALAYLGARTAISGALAAATTTDGRAFIYLFQSGSWSCVNSYESDFSHTVSVATDGSTVVVGEAKLNQFATLVPTDPSWADFDVSVTAGFAGTSFGKYLSMADGVLAVGAPDYIDDGGAEGALFVFAAAAPGEWRTLVQVNSGPARSELGSYVATDGTTVVSRARAPGQSRTTVLALSADVGHLESAMVEIADLSSGTDVEMLLNLLEPGGMTISNEYEVQASFEPSAPSLRLAEWDGTGYIFTSSLPSAATPSTLWLRVSNVDLGSYKFDFIPLEVRKFFLPVTGIEATPATAVLGETRTYTVSSIDAADISSFPLFFSFGDGQLPVRAECSGAQLEVALPSPSTAGAHQLRAYRCYDTYFAELSATVTFDEGSLTSLIVFPDAMAQGSLVRVFFGYLNEVGAAYRRPVSTTISHAVLSGITAHPDASNGWYYFDVVPDFDALELTFAADDGIVTPTFTATLTNLGLSQSKKSVVGETLELSIQLANSFGFPVLDGRDVSANFGQRGVTNGIFAKPTLRTYQLPFSYENYYSVEMSMPQDITLDCAFLYTSLSVPVSDTPGHITEHTSADAVAFNWIDSNYAVIGKGAQVLTASSQGDGYAKFAGATPFLGGQVFYVGGNPATEIYLFDGQYPMLFDSVGLHRGTRLDTPAGIRVSPCSCGGLDSFDPVTHWSGYERDMNYLYKGSDALRIANGIITLDISPHASESPCVFVTTELDQGFAFFLEDGTFLSYDGAQLVVKSLPSNNAWTLTRNGAGDIAGIEMRGYSLNAGSAPPATTRFDNLAYRGNWNIFSSILYGGGLLAPIAENDPVAFAAVNQLTSVRDTPESFLIYHRFGAVRVEYSGFLLAFGSTGFFWTTTYADSMWFRPIEQSFTYENYLFLFGEDQYLCADASGNTYASTEPDLSCVFQLDSTYYPLRRAAGTSILVLNAKQGEAIKTVLDRIVPDATVTVTTGVTITGTYDLIITEPVDGGLYTEGELGIAVRGTAEIGNIGFALANAMTSGTNVLLTYDSCVKTNQCGPQMRTCMGLGGGGATPTTSFDTIEFVGDPDLPFAGILPGAVTGSPVALSAPQQDIYAHVDPAEITPLYKGTGGDKPFAWIRDTGTYRFAYVSIAPLSPTDTAAALNSNERQILEALILWSLKLLD
eukprot:gnl/Chilomastix_cuspidata/1840.p1 GENE.gnl/Chilomastix_cuspidata/1840~~gnl/Chilomastix_cuspidata/1840.p1  ORF type:complete len:1431 (-),score=503.36 gnl/Chilomastix_cuspidata/1840:242-4534(-)